MKSITFFDLEIDPYNHRIVDIGSIKSNGETFTYIPIQKNCYQSLMITHKYINLSRDFQQTNH